MSTPGELSASILREVSVEGGSGVATQLASLAFGVVLGMRHAFEPDHLAAVASLVAQEKRPRGATLLGAFWGAGHTAALLVAGGRRVRPAQRRG